MLAVPAAMRTGRLKDAPQTGRIRRFSLRRAAVAAALSLTAPALASAQVGPLDYESFLAEMNDAGAQYVVVSNHFRHKVACSGRGCILMGPTDDREACRQWAGAYNKLDPLDYARCVESKDYDALRY